MVDRQDARSRSARTAAQSCVESGSSNYAGVEQERCKCLLIVSRASEAAKCAYVDHGSASISMSSSPRLLPSPRRRGAGEPSSSTRSSASSIALLCLNPLPVLLPRPPAPRPSPFPCTSAKTLFNSVSSPSTSLRILLRALSGLRISPLGVRAPEGTWRPPEVGRVGVEVDRLDLNGPPRA